VCSLFVWNPPASPIVAVIQTEWHRPTPVRLEVDPPLSIEAEDPREPGGSQQQPVVFESPAPDRDALPDPVLLDPPPPPTGGTPSSPDSLPEMWTSVDGGADDRRPGQGMGEGTGTAAGDGPGNQFFGLTSPGRRVVFVVDASRSMNHPHPGPQRTRFGRVKLELVRSISQMTPDQEFFIVYFNDHALPMPARALAPATRSSQEKYLRWAVEMRADGQTDPEEALLLALALKPEVIYFLTDGVFKARIVKQVSQANRQRIAIHTIGFGDNEAEALLQQIAFQNWGTYRFIPAEEAVPPAPVTSGPQ
jgi:hypothetical protein